MTKGIPFYELYGETFLREETGLIHIEDIAHRSRGLDWKIAPHRHDKLIQIVFTFDEKWQVSLDGNYHHLDSNCVVLIPPAVVHSFDFRANVRGYVLSLNQGMLFEALEPNSHLDLIDLLSAPQIIEFKSDAQMQRFISYIDLLVKEIHNVELDQEFVLERLVQLVLVALKRQLAVSSLQGELSGHQSSTLLNFKRLIEQDYCVHNSVKHYAQQLHVSVATLNRLCKAHLKASPKTLIHQRLITEAKRKLLYTRQSIEDIAFSLGFKDVGYFSRVFKKATGETAGHYRKAHSF